MAMTTGIVMMMLGSWAEPTLSVLTLTCGTYNSTPVCALRKSPAHSPISLSRFSLGTYWLKNLH